MSLMGFRRGETNKTQKQLNFAHKNQKLAPFTIIFVLIVHHTKFAD